MHPTASSSGLQVVRTVRTRLEGATGIDDPLVSFFSPSASAPSHLAMLQQTFWKTLVGDKYVNISHPLNRPSTHHAAVEVQSQAHEVNVGDMGGLKAAIIQKLLVIHIVT